MDISQLLKPDAIKSVGSISSKKRLFQEISDVASNVYALDQAQVLASLQDRENLGPTGFGKGVALPHARLDGLEQVVAIFLRLDTPLDFDATDRQPVDLFFGLLAPHDAGVEHLKALALVSRTMRDGDICAKLRANDDQSTLFAILTEGPASQAA